VGFAFHISEYHCTVLEYGTEDTLKSIAQQVMEKGK